MPKAEKEFILNYAMNRWQLNFKKNVGPTSDSIRLCNPGTKEEWEDYFIKMSGPPGILMNWGTLCSAISAMICPGRSVFIPI